MGFFDQHFMEDITSKKFMKQHRKIKRDAEAMNRVLGKTASKTTQVVSKAGMASIKAATSMGKNAIKMGKEMRENGTTHLRNDHVSDNDSIRARFERRNNR